MDLRCFTPIVAAAIKLIPTDANRDGSGVEGLAYLAHVSLSSRKSAEGPLTPGANLSQTMMPRVSASFSQPVPQNNLLTLLEGGDRRSLGRADEVAQLVIETPSLFPTLIEGLCSSDPLVRMRAADAAEKVTRTEPALLAPFRDALLALLEEVTQQEVRWHLALMVGRLSLDHSQRESALFALEQYLSAESAIVKTCALQGMADLVRQDPGLRPQVIDVLRHASRTGTPAMKARSRKLLLQLETV